MTLVQRHVSLPHLTFCSTSAWGRLEFDEKTTPRMAKDLRLIKYTTPEQLYIIAPISTSAMIAAKRAAL